MPVDEPPPVVQGGSLEQSFVSHRTLRSRDGDALWESFRKTFANAETRYVLDAAAVHANGRGFTRTCRNNGVLKRPRENCDICRTVAITFHKKWREIRVIS